MTPPAAISVDAFAAIGERLCADLAHPGAYTAARTTELCAGPTATRCDVALFGGDTGRVAAIVNPRLVDDEHRPIGVLGLFEHTDDAPAAAALLDGACAWLREHGCAIVRGPMNFTTWHDYRFTVRGFEAGWAPGEPWHPRFYPKLWVEAGFTPCATYTSNWFENPERVGEQLAPKAQQALDQGYSIRAMTPRDLPALYRLSSAAFADAYMYSPIDADEFGSLYTPASVAAASRSSYIAHSPEGEPAGLAYSYPYTFAGHTTLIGKTIAVAPSHRRGPLYPLLLRTWALDGVADGHTQFLSTLMHVAGDGPSRMGWTRPDTIVKEYALYERAT